MVRPAKYHSDITVQTREKDENEIGGWSNVWNDWFTTRASVEPMEGPSRLEYGKLKFSTVYRLEMRSRDVNVTGECRIVFNGENYQINELSIYGRVIKCVIAR